MCVWRNTTPVTIPFSPEGEGTMTEPSLTQGRDCWRQERFAKTDESLANAAPGFLKAPWQLREVNEGRMDTEDEEEGEVSKDTSSVAWAGLVHPRNGTL